MLRKLNFTERARIRRSDIQIALRRDPDGVLAFDPLLSLTSVDAPPQARVYIEAYYRSSYMRFDCGTVAAPAPPADRRLTDIESGHVVRFRIKVVDTSGGRHRIVAAADDITAAAEKPESGGRLSLLPVNFCDLADQVWRITFDANGAVLDLNNRVDGIAEMAKLDPRFFALVYPAAVREILTQILLIEGYETTDDPTEWWSLWLRWAADLTGAAAPDDEDEQQAWIDDVVNAFCAKHQAIRRLASQAETA